MYKSNKKINPIYAVITVPLMLAVRPVFQKYIGRLDNDFVFTIGTLILGYFWLWISIIALHKYYIYTKHYREINQLFNKNAEDI